MPVLDRPKPGISIPFVVPTDDVSSVFYLNPLIDPMEQFALEDRDYMNLVDFAIAFRNSTLWGLENRLLNTKFREDCYSADAFKDYVVTYLYANQGFKGDYGKEEEYRYEDDEQSTKTVYVHLPSARSIMECFKDDGTFLEENTSRIQLEFDEQSLGADKKSQKALGKLGFELLDQITDNPVAWISDVFDKSVWPAIMRQRVKDSSLGNYNNNGRTTPQPPPEP